MVIWVKLFITHYQSIHKYLNDCFFLFVVLETVNNLNINYIVNILNIELYTYFVLNVFLLSKPQINVNYSTCKTLATFIINIYVLQLLT